MGLYRSRLGSIVVACLMLAGTVIPLAAAPIAPMAQAPPASFITGAVQPFGVSTNVVTRYGKPGQLGKPLDLVKQMGAGVILEQFRWDKLEHPCNQFDWIFYDELVQEAAKRNLQIIAQLGFNNEQCVAEQFTHSPPDPTRWAAFLKMVVTRYKDYVHTWEIWNEPDVMEFWTGTPQQFADLMKLSYQTIKGIDPNARVINGACSQLDMVWCGQYLALGGANYSDVFGFHPYVGRTNFDNGMFAKTDLGNLRNIQGMTHKQIWFTEFGWSSGSASAEVNPASSPELLYRPNPKLQQIITPLGSSNALGSEQLQARYLVKQSVVMLSAPALDLGPMLWYDFRDDGTDPTAPEAHFGLVQNDWTTPKAGYFAFQQVSSRLTGASFVEQLESGAGTAYRFSRSNGSFVDVVWGGGRTNLPTESRDAQAFNLSGQPLQAMVLNDHIQLDIADDPVFIEHTGGSTTAVMTAPVMTQSMMNPPSSPSITGGTTNAPMSAMVGGSANTSMPPTGGTSTNVSASPSGSGSSAPMTMPAPANAASSGGAPNTMPVIAPSSSTSGGITTWSDPGGFVQVQYPATWRATRPVNSPTTILELDGPDNLFFLVDLYDQQATPSQVISAFQSVHAMSTMFIYVDGNPMQAQVGGESGAAFLFTYVATGMPATGTRDGALWVVDHGGKEFDFQVRNVGTHANDVNAILNSVTFLR